MRLIVYYDLFDHPLTLPELRAMCDADPTSAVDVLAARGHVERTGRWVHVPGRAGQIPKRQARAAAAERAWPAAKRAGRFLAGFPWVRAVFVTGSLSKRSAEPDGDVDFLLVVCPGRVWSARSALQSIRRVLPSSARESLCTNYIVSADALAIPDRTPFHAMELATAVPLHGPEAAVALLRANPWVAGFVPGYSWSLERAGKAAPLTGWGRALEALGSDAVDARLRGAWDRFWSRKYGFLDPAALAHRFRRSTGASTNHLHDHSARVNRALVTRCAALGVPVPELDG